MKITPEMEAMCSKLETLAVRPVHRNEAKGYFSLKVLVGKSTRIAITIDQNWTSFSTEDHQLLERLKAGGIASCKYPSSDSKYRYSYRFPGLTPEMVDSHLEDFRKLIEQSIDLKQQRA